MATTTEIPLTPSKAAIFSIVLADATYTMRLTYNVAQNGCWVLDIGDADENLLVAGIPLVTGVNLLAQYSYLNFDGALIVTTDRGAGEVPSFDGLGNTSHLYFLTA